MSNFTIPSTPQQVRESFDVEVGATGAVSRSIPAPVNGRLIGGTIRCEATNTDITIGVAYGGAEVPLAAPVNITTALTYRFDVDGGGVAVKRDSGTAAPTANQVVRIDFTNESAFAAMLHVRLDFNSAQ